MEINLREHIFAKFKFLSIGGWGGGGDRGGIRTMPFNSNQNVQVPKSAVVFKQVGGGWTLGQHRVEGKHVTFPGKNLITTGKRMTSAGKNLVSI